MTKQYFFKFQIDCFITKPVSVVIRSENIQDAKYDALTIAMKEFGNSSRIKGDGQRINKLSKKAISVKNAIYKDKQWAWITIG